MAGRALPTWLFCDARRACSCPEAAKLLEEAWSRRWTMGAGDVDRRPRMAVTARRGQNNAMASADQTAGDVARWGRRAGRALYNAMQAVGVSAGQQAMATAVTAEIPTAMKRRASYVRASANASSPIAARRGLLSVDAAAKSGAVVGACAAIRRAVEARLRKTRRHAIPMKRRRYGGGLRRAWISAAAMPTVFRACRARSAALATPSRRCSPASATKGRHAKSNLNYPGPPAATGPGKKIKRISARRARRVYRTAFGIGRAS